MYGVQLIPDIIQILIMLFTGGVILTYCVKGLQIQINIVKQYTDNLSTTNNMCKAKIIVIGKGSFLGANKIRGHGNEVIEAVNCL